MVAQSIIVAALGLLVLGIPMTAIYLTRLPVAPSCPTCRSVTHEAAATWASMRGLASVTLTSIRACTRCGWHGRMRWKYATERSTGDRS